MTDIVTDEIVEKATKAYWNTDGVSVMANTRAVRAALLAVSADIAAAAVAAEREACAKIAATAADNPLFDHENGFVRRVGSWIAAAIKARKG